MDQRQQEYIEYYRVRASKYQGNPLYAHSAAAEQALYDAIRTAPSLEAFGERLRNEGLDLRCAIARVRDQAIASRDFYLSIDERVRARAHEVVLAELDANTWTSAADVITMVTRVHAQWNLEITRDELLRDEFWNAWKILEDVACYAAANVPATWHAERAELQSNQLAAGANLFREHTLPEWRKFVPDYAADWQALWETRHRRLFPLADDVVAEQMAAHQRYVGVR